MRAPPAEQGPPSMRMRDALNPQASPPPLPEEAAPAYERDFKLNVKLENLETLEGKHN